VLTAADANSTSFGCSDEREWTYFGEAFFLHSLQPGTRLEDAFAAAKQLVSQWEQRDGMPPSNPQAHFGPKLMARLAPVYVARHAMAPQAGERAGLVHGAAPGRP
jgi:hypothetical protein